MPQLRNSNAVRWDFLEGTIGRGVNPTDVDLAYERHGKFLFLEGKRPGVASPRGQAIFFDRLAAIEGVTVMRFEGTPPCDVTAFGLWGYPLQPGTADELRDWVREWWLWASGETRAA